MFGHRDIDAYDVSIDDFDDPVTVARLAEIEPGDPVEYRDGQYGTVVEAFDSDFTWPPKPDDEADEDDMYEVDDDQTVYIVARESGGIEPFDADDLKTVDRETAFGEPEKDPEERIKEAQEDAEMAAVYDNVDGCPCDVTVEELIDLPGVDDPGVGWSSYPDSWRKSERPNRVILLDAWTSMGATFRGCRREMAGEMVNPNRFCASMKDSVYGTEMWRSFND